MNKDMWIPCWNDDGKNIRDWASLGEKGLIYKHFGESHVDKFKYPAWGDDPNLDREYMTGIMYRKKEVQKAF